MKIIPLGNRIQLDIKEPAAGELSLQSMPTAIEYGTVIGIGPDVSQFWAGKELPVHIKVGDKVFFKSWAVDIITHEGKKYYFISEDTKGLCAIVKP